jgi:hypothetical protein
MSEVSREHCGSYSVDDADQLPSSDTLDGRGVSDLLDEGYSPPEKWSAGEGFGTTPPEALRGETFAQRLAQDRRRDRRRRCDRRRSCDPRCGRRAGGAR